LAVRTNRYAKRSDTTANLGFEAQPWLMANAFRGSMDPALDR